jgi:hypothetical protein
MSEAGKSFVPAGTGDTLDGGPGVETPGYAFGTRLVRPHSEMRPQKKGTFSRAAVINGK